jgi:hypothetical protein
MFNCNPLKKDFNKKNKRQRELTYYRKHLTQFIQQQQKKHQNWIKNKNST